MKLVKILGAVAAVLVLVVVGAAVWVATLDFNDYKPQIAAQVKQHTGRDLTIEGDIELALSLTPTFAVNGVRLANAEWGSQPDMLAVERFEAKAALLPLISGTVDVERIVLKNAKVLIEKDARGRANYEFADGEAKPADTGTGGGPTAMPLIRSVDIENLALTYRDAATDQTMDLSVASLTLRADGPGAPLDLAFAATYNGVPVKGKGTFGALAALTGGAGPWPAKLDVETAGATLGVDGSIAAPLEVKGLDLAVRFAQSDLSKMSGLAGAELPPVGPVDLSAKISGAPSDKLRISDIAAKVGGSDLSGSLDLALAGARPHVRGKLSSQTFDLTDFVKESPEQKSAAGAGQGAGAAADGRVFPDDPLPLEGLKAANADLEIEVAKLLAGVVAENVQVTIALKDGDLRVAPFKAVTSEGAIDGRLRVNAAGATPQVATALKVKNFNLGLFLSEMEITDVLDGAVDADVDVTGSGRSVRQIMAGLNGKTSVVMGEGRMRTEALDLYIGGITAVLSKAGAALYAGAKPEYTVVNCAVQETEIKNGMATVKALVFDTEVWTIHGAGSVNLATEQLDLKIGTEPKAVTVNTAVPVTITGTMAKPSFGIDPLGAARKVGGLLGTALFPPAALVGLVELGSGSNNPCLQTAASGAPAEQQPASGVGGVIQDVEKGVGGAIRGLFGR